MKSLTALATAKAASPVPLSIFSSERNLPNRRATLLPVASQKTDTKSSRRVTFLGSNSPLFLTIGPWNLLAEQEKINKESKTSAPKNEHSSMEEDVSVNIRSSIDFCQ